MKNPFDSGQRPSDIVCKCDYCMDTDFVEHAQHDPASGMVICNECKAEYEKEVEGTPDWKEVPEKYYRYE